MARRRGWQISLFIHYVALSLAISLLIIDCGHDRQLTKGSSTALRPDLLIKTVLQDGDLICRLGDSWYSTYLCEVASRTGEYSHIGIVAYAGTDSCAVYHSEYDDAAKHHGLVLEGLASFLARATKVGVYRVMMDRATQERVLLVSRQYAERLIPFDFDFDSDTDERLYCTEFVVRVLVMSGVLESVPPTGQMGNYQFYTIDDALGRAIPVWRC